jgi:hypothetical protein
MRQTAQEPLRALTDDERQQLAALVRARSERADVQQRAVPPLLFVCVVCVQGRSLLFPEMREAQRMPDRSALQDDDEAASST